MTTDRNPNRYYRQGNTKDMRSEILGWMSAGVLAIYIGMVCVSWAIFG